MRLGRFLFLLLFVTALSVGAFALTFAEAPDCAGGDADRILIVMSDSSSPQIWDVPVTPSQRVKLLSVFFPVTTGPMGQPVETPSLDRAEGKRMRRALRAFGVDVIREMARKTEGRISSTLANCRDPKLHRITAENLDFMIDKIAKVPARPSDEIEIGPLFDVLEVVKASKGVPDYSTIEYCEGFDVETLATFGEVAEDWTPPPEDKEPDEITCPSCGQTFSAEEAAGAAKTKAAA